MDAAHPNQAVEIRLTYRYIKAHPWTVQAITGFCRLTSWRNPVLPFSGILTTSSPACMSGSVRFLPT